MEQQVQMRLAFQTQQTATLQEITLETGRLPDLTLNAFLTPPIASLDTLVMVYKQEAMLNAFYQLQTVILIILIMEQENVFLTQQTALIHTLEMAPSQEAMQRVF